MYAKPARNRMAMVARAGQCSRAWFVSRWCSEDFVDSGMLGTASILTDVRVHWSALSACRRAGGAVRVDNGVMSMSSPFVIVLTSVEEAVLTARARAARGQHRDVIRARVVLAAAQGGSNAVVAPELGVVVDTVRKWRRRFSTGGLPGLEDRPRSGRPRRFTPVQVAQVKALACTPPQEADVPLSRWSSSELATEATTRGLASAISPTTVRRWLAADAIKPWQHRSWIFPRDPRFEDKAARVLDL